MNRLQENKKEKTMKVKAKLRSLKTVLALKINSKDHSWGEEKIKCIKKAT